MGQVMIFGSNKTGSPEENVEIAADAGAVDAAVKDEVLTQPENPEKDDAALEQAKRNLQVSKMLTLRFGEVVSLLMRTPSYKHYTLADMEWVVVPPLLHDQILIAEARDDAQGIAMPVGAAFWARVCDEVDEKLSNNLDRSIRLHPNEWQGGEHLWLIDVVGAPQIVKGLMDQLGEKVFEGKGFKVRKRDKDGKRVVEVMGYGDEQLG